MGFLDDLFSDPFDFDGNGERSMDEDFMAFMTFNAVMNDEADDFDPDDPDDD